MLCLILLLFVRITSIWKWASYFLLHICIVAVNMAFSTVKGQTWHSGSSVRVLPLCEGMKREEAIHHEATPNEIPSGELCKYFHPLPRTADRLIPLTFLINHWHAGRSWDGRNWISGHMAVVGNCLHQHPVCNSILSSAHTQHIQAHVCTGR